MTHGDAGRRCARCPDALAVVPGRRPRRAAGERGRVRAHRDAAPGRRYAPTFTGNGLLGVRVPPAGAGLRRRHRARAVRAGRLLRQAVEGQGARARPAAGQHPQLVGADVRRRRHARSRRSRSARPRAGASRSTCAPGVISTSARWRAPDGHVTGIAYQVFTDRAREHVGVVRLTLRPQWTGTATVTDAIDGTADRVTGPKLPPVLTQQTGKGWNLAARAEWLSVRDARHRASPPRWPTSWCRARTSPPPARRPTGAVSQSVGQRITFPVTAGQTYTLTKYVGVEDSQTADRPRRVGAADAAGAATAGLRRAAGRERRRLGDAVAGPDRRRRQPHRRHRRQRLGVLSVVQHPRRPGLERLPRRPVLQRLRRPHLLGRRDVDVPVAAGPASGPGAADGGLPVRSAVARPSGMPPRPASRGARFPWESALDGTEQIPPPVSVNSEGLYEQHITADIALAQWQYYEATGDIGWLRDAGVAGALRSRDVLGLARDRAAPTAATTSPRHRPRRGEPERDRRGVHQRRRQDDPARRDRRRRRCSASPVPGELVAGRRAGSSCRSRTGSTPSTPATAISSSSRPT